MTGIDRHTGKVIEEPEHIRQGIEVILTTPIGSRVMQREFGFDCINLDGSPKPGVTADQAERSALSALSKYKPRIQNVTVSAAISQYGALSSIDVSYTEIKTGSFNKVTVVYPNRTG